ncbi:MAG: hypothetical protein ASARMPRED_002950 [Alectoria sarmentosa]|nr:MAG: hypothetical protein ASARMPRED_002950 [Alectoria sarmentosa]
MRQPFEFDADAFASQRYRLTVPDIAPQVIYDTSLPESQDASTKDHAPSHRITKPSPKWPLMAIALIIHAAVAVGAGVGIWRHRKHSSQKSSANVSPSAPSNPNVTRAAQNILNDTYLAAVSLVNGDRQLFFQDSTGLIRRAIRTASTNQWSTNVNQNVQWWEVYSTAVDTRSLSINTIGGVSSNSTMDLALLYYEIPNGIVSALLQRWNSTVYPNGIFEFSNPQWVDITSQDSKSLPDEFRSIPTNTSSDILYSNALYESDTNATFSTPFTSGGANNISGSLMKAISYSPSNDSPIGEAFVSGGAIVYTGYMVGPNGSGKFNQGTVDLLNDTSIHQSDIAMSGGFATWIYGTQPVLCPSAVLALGIPLPNNTFPFARLANINGTTFAEEQWDDALLTWIPSEYITVFDL